ncbi:MAG: YeeE/YedE thiosulfate transporter family protein [Actinomycetota bacterium]
MANTLTKPQSSFWDRLTKRQWSFLFAGLVFGLAQIIYMATLWLDKAMAGGDAVLKPITVTTDLGKMFRGLEVGINSLFGFQTELYGSYVDGVASGGAFVPGIGWPIVGMAIGGLIVVIAEREHRSWVKYPLRVLGVSFVGGMVFSYGTRLAGGCTLNHLLGGIPMMSIHSTFTVVFMAIGGAVSFLIMTKLGIGQYFKHQETKSYCESTDSGECPAYDSEYKWYRNPWYWVGASFSIALILVALIGGLFNPEALQSLKDGEMVAFSKSVAAKSWLYVIGTLAAGTIGGIAMAKSGFGTECALVSLEVSGSMTKNDSKYARMGIPRITRTLMRGYLPIIGLAASWVLTAGFIWFGWNMGAAPGFEGSLKYQFTAGSIVGGLLLGLGAVMLIGCEIRSYMRIGMGYLNTLVGFIGFAIGYLPYTLFLDGHKSFLENTVIIEQYKWYELIAPNSVGTQKIVYLVWTLLLVVFLLWLIRVGAKRVGVSRRELRTLNTEDLELTIDARAEDGMIHGVSAPAAVPGSHDLN